MNLAYDTAALVKKSVTENPFFQPDNAYLRRAFAASSSPDPSMHSLGYIRMTSRKGLSCYQGEFSDVLFSLHPNNDDEYIIYPPEDKQGYFDVRELSQILKVTGKQVEIVRVPESLSSYAASIVGGERSFDTDLDYIYPVHIVDTKTLSEMSGGKFLKFRNKVNASTKEGTSVRPTSFSAQDLQNMRQVVSQWAPALFGSDYEDHTDYIEFVFDELLSYPNIKGLISEQNGMPNGFTIWEEPQNGYDTANSLIHCSLHQRGISELLHLEMAKTLRDKGILRLSLGGAETKGLDEFKRKMQPVHSIKLDTIYV